MKETNAKMVFSVPGWIANRLREKKTVLNISIKVLCFLAEYSDVNKA